MKSKIYSSGYVKISSKGLIWIPAFIAIGFLLAFPVAELILLGNWFGMEYSMEQIQMLYENLWCDGFLITGIFVSILAAVVTAFSQFWYLYSSRKVDFYHSLPVKRNQMFWCKIRLSVLYYLVPYLIMEFFSICIGAMRGFFSLHLMKLAFFMAAIHLLVYLLVYFVVTVVICITGHALMGGLCLVSVAVYGPLLACIVKFYESAFYKTYANIYYGLTDIFANWGSPVTLTVTLWEKYAEGEGKVILLTVLLLVIAGGCLSYFVYTRRKSEMTGKAFVFPLAGLLARILLIVPSGLGVGMIFYMLPTDNSRTIWWIFGMILGTVLSGGVLGILYYMDVRKFFADKLQLALCGLLVALCAVAFQFDLTDYDGFFPSYESIESVCMKLPGEECETFSAVEIDTNGEVKNKIYYNEERGYGSRSCELGINQSIYEILKKIKEENPLICAELESSVENWNSQYWESEENYCKLHIKYQLKSGAEKYRVYWVKNEVLKELYCAGYDAGELKNQKYSTLVNVDEKYLKEVYGVFADGQTHILYENNSAKQQQLLEALRQDVEEADGTALTEEPCALLYFEYEKVPFVSTVDSMVPGSSLMRSMSGNYYVFPKFHRTIEFLKENGYPMSVEELNITSVDVQYYMDKDFRNLSSTITYDKPEQIAELKKGLRCSNLIPVWESAASYELCASMLVNVDGILMDNNLNCILTDQVPQFMTEDSQRALAFVVLEES